MSAYNKETMRERFWELTAQKEALAAKTAPYREKRDALRDALRDPMAEYKASQLAVVAMERPLMGEINMEMAVLARGLGNKVGLRPVATEES